MGVGTPKKKIVRRKNETETARAMVKKLAKTKLIRAVRLRDFLEEGIFDLVADGRRELAHVAVPRRGFDMYEENGIVRLLARSLARSPPLVAICSVLSFPFLKLKMEKDFEFYYSIRETE